MIHHVIYELGYLEIYGLVFFYFLLLYFGLAPLFLQSCKYLTKKNILHQIENKDLPSGQIRYEVLHSLKSIFVFGFSGLPIIYLIRMGGISLADNSVFNILWGVLLLNLWNEIHFFVVHRILHLPLLMKRIHYIHHKSKIPTVYSVYSFHWIEAFLLSTVPLTIAPFIDLAPLVFVFYPFTSILLNFSGHCNYRFGNGEGKGSKMLGTRHNRHHTKFRQTYGFATDWMDRMYQWVTDRK